MEIAAKQMRDRLRKIYENYWPSLQDALLGRDDLKNRLGGPFLMDVCPEYFAAQKKLLIVGQQTKGWGNAWTQEAADDAIGFLMQIYAGFRLGENYLPTPFWAAAHQVYRKLNPAGPSYGFLWTNLVKVDQDEGQPDAEVEEIVSAAFPVLPEEIEVVSPGIVVFFTGRYDHRLRRTFPGVRFEEVAGLPRKVLAKLVHERLPEPSYRTYHPSYFVRSSATLCEHYAAMLSAIADGCIS